MDHPPVREPAVMDVVEPARKPDAEAQEEHLDERDQCLWFQLPPDDVALTRLALARRHRPFLWNKLTRTRWTRPSPHSTWSWERARRSRK
jgi:hypothetical protein